MSTGEVKILVFADGVEVDAPAGAPSAFSPSVDLTYSGENTKTITVADLGLTDGRLCAVQTIDMSTGKNITMNIDRSETQIVVATASNISKTIRVTITQHKEPA